jgi:hypothetical protein
VFNFRNNVVSALFLAVNLLLAFSSSQAADGLFDRWTSRTPANRKAAVAAAKSSETHTKAPASPTKVSTGKVRLAGYDDDGDLQSSGQAAPTTIDQGYPPPSIPAAPAESVPVFPVASSPIEVFENSTYCLNCGQDDHCQKCLRNCRKNCKQTWYPRVAPYCQPGWGWNQPCWRRAADTYDCPRPQQLAPPQRRVSVPEAPAEESSVDAPVDDSGIIRDKTGQ